MPALPGHKRREYRAVIANTEGSVSSTGARLGVIELLITGQPIRQTKDAGQMASFTVALLATAPLTYQWWKDGIALSQATNVALTLTNLQANDIGAYQVVASNPFGSATSALAQLTVNLTTLNAGFPGANGSVYSVALQPDRKILVGGAFASLGGHPRSDLARLIPGRDNRAVPLPA